MIRSANSFDRSAVSRLTEAIGFEEAEVAEVLSSFDATYREHNPARALWFVDDDDYDGDGRPDIQAVAYVEPERMTAGTYNLLLIAVHPLRQKQGRGKRLIRHVERAIAALGGRLLLVETMGTDDFAYVRRLYEKLGFTEEAIMRDFYADGCDKVVYQKWL